MRHTNVARPPLLIHLNIFSTFLAGWSKITNQETIPIITKVLTHSNELFLQCEGTVSRP